MAYWRLFYHIIWATKDRLPLITPDVEPQLYKVLLSKSKDMGGFGIIANGMPDHMHMIAAIPPTIAISDFVKNVKGTSSRFVSTTFETPFAWQSGYGVFTVSPGRSNLQKAIDYVKFQKQHHASNSVYRMLERHTIEDDGPKFAYPR